MSRWINDRKRDFYHRMAKEKGYRSRAAFKLKQLNQRFGFLKDAKNVLDLGAAPGGWLQVVGETVKDGLIVGVDIEKIDCLDYDNVKTIVGDIMEGEVFEKIRRMFNEKVNVVLSDIAPNISGTWELDHFKQIELARRALNISELLLHPEGWFVVKVFQGREYDNFIKEVKIAFENVKAVKPKASRKESAEMYVVAKKLKTYL